MPWRAMATGPTPALKSVLLDYVSPWNAWAMISAIRASHYVVVLAIIGSLVIKFALVVSTGLLMLQSVAITNHNTSLVATDKFDLAFDGSFFTDNSIDYKSSFSAYGTSLMNLSYPKGTTSQYAMQSFNTSDQTTGKFLVFFSSR